MKKKYQAASTLWDDLDYLEARNTKDELEEKARNERKRKQEIEERAAKKQMAVSSSLREPQGHHMCASSFPRAILRSQLNSNCISYKAESVWFDYGHQVTRSGSVRVKSFLATRVRSNLPF